MNRTTAEITQSYSKIKKTKECINPFLGFFYTLMACIFTLLSFAFTKKLSHIGSAQLALIGNWVLVTGVLPIAVYKVRDILGKKDDRKLLAARAVLAGISYYLHITALKYISLADVTIILSTVPAVINIIAHIYLKEPCGLIQTISVLLTIIGVLLSAHLLDIVRERSNTQFDSDYILGLACEIFCVITLSFTYILTRKTKNTHYSVCLLYVGFIGLLGNGIINIFSGYTSPNCGWDIIYLSMVGVLIFVGQCFLQLAVQTELVGIIAVIRASLDVIISIVFQILFFTSKPDLCVICGACFVLLSLGILGVQKYLFTLPEDSKRRQYCKYFLL